MGRGRPRASVGPSRLSPGTRPRGKVPPTSSKPILSGVLVGTVMNCEGSEGGCFTGGQQSRGVTRGVMETEGASLAPDAPAPASAWLRVTRLLSLVLRPCLTQPRPQKRCQSLSPASYTLRLPKPRSFPSSFP